MTRRGKAATECREAHGSAWSLLPLWDAVGGPEAPASWPHSKRFARFARLAAQLPNNRTTGPRDNETTGLQDYGTRGRCGSHQRFPVFFPSSLFPLPSSLSHPIREIRG